jgi:dTDP-4-dehydrorhamnose reductase
MDKTTILVTGGAGFIGSAVRRRLVASGRYRVINLDKLTYSGKVESLREIAGSPDYAFYQADICDGAAVAAILRTEKVQAMMHLAAESHVDRSIDGPAIFLDTNVIGTFRLLDAALAYWREAEEATRAAFRFHHISTDEVFGDLPFDSGIFTEETAYAPSSPYSASKAAADHLVRAWPAGEDVVARAAVDHVVADAARDRVVAVPAGDGVVAVAGGRGGRQPVDRSGQADGIERAIAINAERSDLAQGSATGDDLAGPFDDVDGLAIHDPQAPHPVREEIGKHI